MLERQDPSIEEMLIDPITRAVMAADGVDADELKSWLRVMATFIRSRSSGGALGAAPTASAARPDENLS